jgi:hypothetical protein
VLRLKQLVLWIRTALGYVPNAEWLRAQLSRAIVLDRARAQAAIAETERCLRVRDAGGGCARFPSHVR